MSVILKLGQVVQAEFSRLPCHIRGFLGGGTQGEVYRVELDGQPVALKWYTPGYLKEDKGVRARLERAVRLGAPSDRFLWPTDLATAEHAPAFGYVMPLLPDGFRGLTELVTRRVEPSLRALATAGFELSNSFFELHAKGLCYRDISFGNVFLHPETGDVLIADNDNVDVDGTPGPILGTPGFIAPEILRGEALPSRKTDLFSLANLLFQMFVLHHPLEGKREADIHCFNLAARRKIHGLEPVFIFDPDDDSNRPVPGCHDNAIHLWPLYPKFLQGLFTQAFTGGIVDPENGRVAETVWRAAMVRLRDCIVYCAYCKVEIFFDADATGSAARRCWQCNERVIVPYRICVGKSVVFLNHDTKLFAHHVEPSPTYDFSTVVAEVTPHPADAHIFGLRNLSKRPWTATTAKGAVVPVEPGRSMQIEGGTRIQFGRAEGEIQR